MIRHFDHTVLLSFIPEMLLLNHALIKLINSLCRNVPSQPTILRGHTDGVSAFSVWGQDIISIARNKIGLSSLSISPDDVNNSKLITIYFQILFLSSLATTDFHFDRMDSTPLLVKSSTWQITEQETSQCYQA